MRRSLLVFALAMLLVAIAVPASAKKKFKSTKQGTTTEVSSDPADGPEKKMRHTPEATIVTVGPATFNIVYMKDGTIEVNGIKARDNNELLAAFAQTGLANAITAEDLDTFLEMLRSGEISIEPKKREEAFVTFLSLWRSRL